MKTKGLHISSLSALFIFALSFQTAVLPLNTLMWKWANLTSAEMNQMPVVEEEEKQHNSIDNSSSFLEISSSVLSLNRINRRLCFESFIPKPPVPPPELVCDRK